MVGGEVVVEDWVREGGVTRVVTREPRDMRERRNRRNIWRERTGLPLVERRELEEKRRTPAGKVEKTRKRKRPAADEEERRGTRPAVREQEALRERSSREGHATVRGRQVRVVL